MNTFASFKTGHAQRYLTALCQHFGRKVTVECDAQNGSVQFAFGRCHMTADDTQLDLSVSAEDPAALDLVVDVVTRHFERYAFRENPTLIWHRTPQ